VEGRRPGFDRRPVRQRLGPRGGWFASAGALQSGYIYHYAFAMIIGMLVLLTLTSLA
jgi:hypothetical protein